MVLILSVSMADDVLQSASWVCTHERGSMCQKNGSAFHLTTSHWGSYAWCLGGPEFKDLWGTGRGPSPPQHRFPKTDRLAAHQLDGDRLFEESEGPAAPNTLSKRRGMNPSPSGMVVGGRRGRPDLQNRRLPADPKTIHLNPSAWVVRQSTSTGTCRVATLVRGLEIDPSWGCSGDGVCIVRDSSSAVRRRCGANVE